MKEKLSEILCILTMGDIEQDEAFDKILALFSVVKRFKATFDNEGTKDIEEYFWAENKYEAFKQVFKKYPKAEFVMI